MKSCSTRKMKFIFSVRPIPQVVASLITVVTAITKMPAPTSKKQVQSFTGMINNLSKFLPDCQRLWSLSENCQKMRYLSTGVQSTSVHL